MNVQFKKGVLELCVLGLLNRKDYYGYDISEFISNHIDIADGTVYPILRKLKSDGLLTTYLSETSGGPPRKYYSLTDFGREEYAKIRQEWKVFVAAVDELIKEEESNNEQETILDRIRRAIKK